MTPRSAQTDPVAAGGHRASGGHASSDAVLDGHELACVADTLAGTLGTDVDPGTRAAAVDRRRAGGPRRRRRRRHNRHLRDALKRHQRIVLAALVLAWALLTVGAWMWLLAPSHVGTPVGFLFNAALIAADSLVLPGWFFFWVWRMRRPDPTLAVPRDLRVAMVVTKAPSEPWEVVRTTLEAMLDQEYPYPYDVWLADERPEDETRDWCAAHSVRISSREGVAEYHRPTWPRRTRCKEGNLAYFYDHWGYELYDVVAQLDADHVPDRDYLRHMVVPFRDPAVGYVAAPSICDRNADRSWSARARLYAEAVLHGPMQAGHSGGCAPSCIGSHYAVRTGALREIGGLGPELAEDFTTSLMLSSRGWQGVFAVDARAHGDGPETVSDFVTQELQWSRSMMNVLIGVGGPYWRGLSRAAKLRLGFCEIWYPLYALLMTSSVVLPLVAVLTGAPPVRAPLGSFYLHFGPPMAVVLAVILWLRRLRWLRPTDARILSIEMLLYQLIRWPWVVLGCVQAIAGRLRGREFDFKVTPKGVSGPQPLPLRILLPYLALGAASAAPALLGVDPGRARGYVVLALANAVLYVGAALAITVLHFRDQRPITEAMTSRSARRIPVGSAAIVLLAACALAAFALLPRAAGAATKRPGTRRPARATTRTSPLTLGVTTFALAANSYAPWTASSLAEVSGFERLAGARAGIVMWYDDWQHASASLAQLRLVGARGSEPEITWEPWDYSGPVSQPRYSLASIIAGRHDAYVRGFARSLKAYGRPVLLRFAQEMNGSWYPWAEGVNGNRRGGFAAAWRHLHDVFARLHVTNVRWVWTPVARGGYPLNAEEYPGNAYVDIVGLSGFNAGTALSAGWGGWRSFAAIFDHSLAQLATIAPGKPVQMSEVGTTSQGGDEAAWMSGMFHDLARRPAVTSLIWFDVAKQHQTDWTLGNSPAAAPAFRSGLRRLQRVSRRAARG